MEYRKKKERKTGAQYVQSVQLGRDLYKDTKKYSAKYNIPMAQVIREALNRFLHPDTDDFGIIYRSLNKASTDRKKIKDSVDLNTELIFNMVRKMYHFIEKWDEIHCEEPSFNAEKRLENFYDEILDAKTKRGLVSERLEQDAKRQDAQ